MTWQRAPLTLLEYPNSVFRIAREIYRRHLESEDRVVDVLLPE